MKKKIYTLGLGMSALLMNAQITLTQSGNAPASGDVRTEKQLDSTAVLDKSSGASKTWDYTGSVTTSTYINSFTTTYTTASSIPGASAFVSAGANVAATDSSDFYKSTSTSLEAVGFMEADGSAMLLSNTAQLMQYPFSYGNTFTDNASGTWTVASVGVFNVSGNISVTADGWGTVILPSSPSNLSFSNVLRVKETITINIVGTGTLSSVTGTVIMTDYLYYKSGTKHPFFTILYNYQNIPIAGPPSNSYEIDYDASLVLNAQEISASNPAVFVYPNPSKDVLNIQMNKTDYKFIKIIDIQGKLVKEISVNNGMDIKSIDIKDLQTGEYVLLLNSSASGLKDISYKFIKE